MSPTWSISSAPMLQDRVPREGVRTSGNKMGGEPEIVQGRRLRRCADTEGYKETRYLLELIGVIGGVGVEVLRHRGNRPLMHDLTM